MIINHNMSSMNANRQIGTNSANASKSMEKLSSGLRINRAGDDAAGLAISEKMRGQIRGLDQASANSQDAISMIQTAEGALNETHSILQRMRELAVQSSTDTNTADDRKKIQSEVDELAKEITRISNTTEFNTQNLLAGGLSDTFQVGANKGQNISLSISGMDAKSLGVSGDIVNTTVTNGADLGTRFNVTTQSEGLNGYFVNIAKVAAGNTASAATGAGAGATATAGGTYTGSSDVNVLVNVTSTDGAGKVMGVSFSADGGSSWANAGAALNTTGADSIFTYQGATITMTTHADVETGFDAVGNTVQYKMQLTAQYLNVQVGTTNAGGVTVGDAGKMYNNMSSITVGDGETDRVATVALSGGATYSAAFTAITATGTTYAAASSATVVQTTTGSTAAIIGANGTVTKDADTKKGLNVSSQGAANNAIETINNAITKVSEERSKLGAYQNRLEHTIANLGTSSENLTSAESRIRDVNMAKEMSTFSKNNILSQAAQAMLAQANQQPQQVLQLLR